MHLDFLSGVAIDVGDAARFPVFVHENILRERVGTQLQVAGRLRFRQEAPRCREERARVAASRTGTAEVAGGTAFVIPGQLRDAVGQVRDADLLRALLQDVIEATEVERGQVFAVGIARPVLHAARHADHAFDAAVERGDFLVVERPVDAGARDRSRSKIDVAEARRRASPEVGLSTDCEASGPHPLRAGTGGEGNLVLPHAIDPFVVHVADRFRTFRRIAETTEFHVPGHAMVAKVLGRIEPASAIDRADFEPRLGERL
jgi:hypothetical protein